MDYDRDYTPAMKRLIALFPQREVSPETIAAYWELLADLGGTAFQQAVAECGRSLRFFPTVRELREAAGETETDREQRRYTAKLDRWRAIQASAERLRAGDDSQPQRPDD